MSKYKNLFQQIGIDEKSGIIYVALVDFGRLNISQISERTDIQRMEIYRKLPYLLESWIIIEVKVWKKKLYTAGSPKILEDLLLEKQREAKNVIWEIQKNFKNKEQRPNVVYQEWWKSITDTFNDIVNTLNTWDVFYRISSEVDVDKSNSYLAKDYRDKRDRKKLERFVITTKNTNAVKKARLERNTVVFPESYEQFDENIQMIIYNNKIAYVDYNNENSIIIENSKISRFQQKIFKALFKGLEKWL